MDQFVRTKHRLGLGTVVGQLGGVGLNVNTIYFSQRLCDPGVQSHLAAGRQFLG